MNHLILYASQTGTAQYYAEETQRRKGGNLKSIDEYDYLHLPDENIVLFLVSTTGDGDPPMSMLKFWKFLLIKDLAKDSLKRLKFSVFGLGDSSYAKFNYAARKLRTRLLQLSAQEIYPSCFGDEMHPCGIDTEYTNWIEQIPKLQIDQYTPQIQIEYIQDFIQNKEQQQIQQQDTQFIFDSKEYLTPQDHTKTTVIYKFKSNTQYKPGDIIKIYPNNNKFIIQTVAEICEYDLIQIIKLGGNNNKLRKLPQQLTIFQLLSEYIDLTQYPTRYFLKVMSQFCEQQLHKDRLLEMCANTPEGLEDYYSYVVREKRSVADILFDFKPCKIPLDYLIDSVRLIRPREYSISSPYNEKSIEITVALVQYTTAKNRLIKGMCTSYLEGLQQGQIIKAEIQNGTLVFPQNGPVIMVGPGTGVAPFISFIKQNLSKDIQFILFFGSCYKEKEFYYEDFFETNKNKIQLYTAFSRDQDKKIYVQHKLIEVQNEIKQIVLNNIESIHIFVAGTSRKMPQQVQDAFKQILGDQILNKLIKNKQYQIECW